MNELTKMNQITEDICRETFARNLREQMAANYYTVSLLSRRAGMNSNTIDNYLSMRTTPTVASVLRLARALNCTFSELAD